jgi:homoserine O-succinyltransferase/O-acetyltransferase
MDIYLDRASFQDSTAVPDALTGTLRWSSPRQQSLTVAIVNNMPDTALAATERQFTRLVTEATQGKADIALYYLPGVPRSAQAQAILDERYRPVTALYRLGADAVIVTGNEPKAARLDQEPYWNEMAALIDWAAQSSSHSLWSCLAAHAVALRLDGIERRRLKVKKSGVLNSTVARPGRLLPAGLSVCHSRMNELPKAALEANGYDIVSEGPGGSVDIFAKRFAAPFLFLQGHPEYDSDSLMKEYRRDVGRFLAGQREDYPEVPENYFDNDTVIRMENFRTLAERSRAPDLIERFPEAALRAGLEQRLAQSAAAVFKTWFAQVTAERAVA